MKAETYPDRKVARAIARYLLRTAHLDVLIAMRQCAVVHSHNSETVKRAADCQSIISPVDTHLGAVISCGSAICESLRKLTCAV